MNRRWTDRILGIVLGLAIGLGVLVYFVFAHSEGTIDAPKVNEGTATGKTTAPSRADGPEAGRPARPGSRGEPAEDGAEGEDEGQPGTRGAGGAQQPGRPLPVVKVIGGAPPTDSGPKQLAFRQGDKVRFEIETNEPFSFAIRGLGIEQSIAESSVISFKATKAGQFPVIATATSIGVADLRIKPPR